MDIDKAVEQARAADVDAICDDDYRPLPFEIVEEKQDIYDLAVVLHGLAQIHLPHVLGFRRDPSRACEIHVYSDWFDGEFSGNVNVVTEAFPRQSAIKLSIDYENVTIFCIKDAEFRVESA